MAIFNSADRLIFTSTQTLYEKTTARIGNAVIRIVHVLPVAKIY